MYLSECLPYKSSVVEIFLGSFVGGLLVMLCLDCCCCCCWDWVLFWPLFPLLTQKWDLEGHLFHGLTFLDLLLSPLLESYLVIWKKSRSVIFLASVPSCCSGYMRPQMQGNSWGFVWERQCFSTGPQRKMTIVYAGANGITWAGDWWGELCWTQVSLFIVLLGSKDCLIVLGFVKQPVIG